MKTETLEEASNRYSYGGREGGHRTPFLEGVKWQKERSEDEVIQFADWILNNMFEMRTDNHQQWWGKFNEEKDYTSKELLEMYKKNT